MNDAECHYIEAKTFEDFKKNQDKLINILNHNITKMTQDISWIKALMVGLLISVAGNFLIGGK